MLINWYEFFWHGKLFVKLEFGLFPLIINATYVKSVKNITFMQLNKKIQLGGGGEGGESKIS
jgi:hypothetical protein